MLDQGLPLAELSEALGVVAPKPGQMAAAAGAIAALGGLAAMFVPALSRLVLQEPQESRLADFLPFEALLQDGKTIRCRDGRLARVVEVRGIDSGPMSMDERFAHKVLRKAWIEDMAVTEAVRVDEMKVVITRRRIGAGADLQFPADMPMMRAVSEKWRGPLKDTYLNRMFVVLSMRGRGESARGRLDAAFRNMSEMLSAFSPAELGEGPGGVIDFWADLLNPGEGNIAFAEPQGTGLGDLLCGSTVEFAGETGIATFRRGEHESLLAALGVRRWGDDTSPDLIAALLSVPAEITLMHLLEPVGLAVGLRRVEQRRMAARSALFEQAALEDLSMALAALESRSGGEGQALVKYQLTVFYQAPDRESLQQVEFEVQSALTSGGQVRAVREGAALMPLYFSLFPGHATYVRETDMFSQNLADLVPFEGSLPGQPRCDWGEGPIAIFRSLSGTPYQFQFHVREGGEAGGHTLVIGPTGTGKTTFLTFLIGHALRHPALRAYIFDSQFGAYVFTTSMGGRYLSFQGSAGDDAGGTRAALNPLQMPTTPENRRFLINWLTLLTGLNGVEARDEFARLVDSLPRLSDDRRQLKAIYDTAFASGSETARALSRWVDDRQQGTIFNGERDTLDLSGTRLVGLDMTDVFADHALVNSIIPYIMHRIRSTVAEGRAPYLVFFDETAHMLRDPLMARFLDEELQQSRKRLGIAVCCFQEPSSLWHQDGHGDIITSACKTQIFFPDSNAKSEHYEPFGLTDHEWLFIKGRHTRTSSFSKHAVLVRKQESNQPAESVILDANLDGLGAYASLFRSGSTAVDRARDTQKLWGDDWVNHYLEATA